MSIAPHQLANVDFPAEANPATDAIPQLKPDALYSKSSLARLFGVHKKTIERWSGISGQDKTTKRTTNPGPPARKAAAPLHQLPPPFYVGRDAYWLGRELLDFFSTRQREANQMQPRSRGWDECG